ncbi:unnamed protein product [marine sediment metagenome]|uniref:Uncharacterized protein n=1 Tax=marine sediment metagenome TaxID=412755 RepID=X1EV26_9ZZZZ
MKKLILALILMVAMGFAANEYLFTTWWADSAFQNKDYDVWEQYFCDTFTLDGLAGDTIIDIGSPAYNPAIRSLNATVDSTYYHVSFDTEKSFFHNDSFARNYLALFSPLKREYIFKTALNKVDAFVSLISASVKCCSNLAKSLKAS